MNWRSPTRKRSISESFNLSSVRMTGWGSCSFSPVCSMLISGLQPRWCILTKNIYPSKLRRRFLDRMSLPNSAHEAHEG